MQNWKTTKTNSKSFYAETYKFTKYVQQTERNEYQIGHKD